MMKGNDRLLFHADASIRVYPHDHPDRNVCATVTPALLEPIMGVEVTTPEEYQGFCR
jgi:hypothetical protein